jgi:hypothetical protein
MKSKGGRGAHLRYGIVDLNLETYPKAAPSKLTPPAVPPNPYTKKTNQYPSLIHETRKKKNSLIRIRHSNSRIKHSPLIGSRVQIQIIMREGSELGRLRSYLALALFVPFCFYHVYLWGAAAYVVGWAGVVFPRACAGAGVKAVLVRKGRSGKGGDSRETLAG